MASLQLQFLNAHRKPLGDTVDVQIVETSSNKLVDLRRGISGKTKLTVSGLAASAVHLVRVFPVRHRPVGGFALTPSTRNTRAGFGNGKICLRSGSRVRSLFIRAYASRAATKPLQLAIACSTGASERETSIELAMITPAVAS